MNTPPASINSAFSPPPDAQSTTSTADKDKTNSPCTTTDTLTTTNPSRKRPHPYSPSPSLSHSAAKMSPRQTSTSHLRGPPSPASATASTSNSIIAVGSGNEEAMYAAAGVPHFVGTETGAGAGPSTSSSTAATQDDPNAHQTAPTTSADSGMGGSEPPDQSAMMAMHGADVAMDAMERLDLDFEGYPESITSSLRNHIYEGGLRYHAYRDGKYAFPNDEVEQNRDDMKHTMTLMLMKQKYFLAPVDKIMEEGGQAIDLGTGTGIWCTELGEMYPNTTIHGIDLSPIQPNMVTDNVYFELDDIEDDWMFPENKFDYVHIRHTLHSIKDRKALMARIYKHLKPGGYLEIQELHYSPHCDDASITPSTPYAFRDFMTYLSSGLTALGSDLHGILSVPTEMRTTGFTDIKTSIRKAPIGVWPRDRDLRYAGLFLRTAIMDGLVGLVKRPFGHGLGWTQLQIEIFLMEVRKAVMNKGFHAYFPFYVVYGRKPLDACGGVDGGGA